VEDVVAGLDRDAAVAAQSLHEFFDAPSGLAFEPSADREGGEHDGEVGFDGVAFVVVDGPGSQVGLGHAEALLDLPQLVVGAHHVLAVAASRFVTWPFSQARARALASRSRLTLLVPPASWTNRFRLTAACPATAFSAESREFEPHSSPDATGT
jgi:hypothetical protein